MSRKLSAQELTALRARYPYPMPLSNEPNRYERQMRQVLEDMNRMFEHLEGVDEPGTNFCMLCASTARRDEKLLDELQAAMVALVAVDGYDDWRVRSLRVQKSIRQAMQLMQVRTW